MKICSCGNVINTGGTKCNRCHCQIWRLKNPIKAHQSDKKYKDRIKAKVNVFCLKSISGYICKLCGRPFTSFVSIKKHLREEHNNCFKKEKRLKPIKHRHHLKPWKDPESLFCSPKLKEITGKEPLKGSECKD